MPINNQIVLSSGTEIDFITDFITSLISEESFTSQQNSHSIVCKINTSDDISTAQEVTASNVSTKVGNAFADSSGRLNVWFTMDTYATLHMVRDQHHNSGSELYNFYMAFNGSEEATPISLRFISSSDGRKEYNAAYERMFAYQIVSNANVLYIVFGGYSNNITFPLINTTNYPCTSLFIYSKTENNNTVYVCGKTVNSTLVGSVGNGLQAVNRLAYNNSVDTTAIETIQNKVIVTTGGNLKAITMDNIWDSTYNYFVMAKVTIGNALYVYLNNYTVMPI